MVTGFMGFWLPSFCQLSLDFFKRKEDMTQYNKHLLIYNKKKYGMRISRESNNLSMGIKCSGELRKR
jgi:hypothetical protein